VRGKVLRDALVLALLLAACGRKTTPASEPARERPGAESVTSAPPGAASLRAEPPNRTNRAPEPNLALGKAVVHVPATLGANEKVPLVVVLHGLGASSSVIERSSDFGAFAQKQRIAWVAPDGSKDTIGRQFWNAGSTCCDFDASAADHVALLRALVTRALAEHPIDPQRVYVVGYSNGGFMAHRLACELDGLIAGIVSVAGAGPKPDQACPAPFAMRILQVNGDKDTIVPIGGGPLFSDARYPTALSAAQTGADWAKRYECAPEPKAAKSFDFEAKIPAAETKVSRYEGCKRGAVELWTVTGGDHYVGFRSPSYEAMWKFLSNQ
jgi:polyhydroxybutyrate depolymerase